MNLFFKFLEEHFQKSTNRQFNHRFCAPIQPSLQYFCVIKNLENILILNYKLSVLIIHRLTF